MKKNKGDQLDWRDEFREKFHDRLEHIARQLNPAGYLVADSYGTVDPDGPQIYGEIKEYISNLISEKEKQAKLDLVNEILTTAIKFHSPRDGGECLDELIVWIEDLKGKLC